MVDLWAFDNNMSRELRSRVIRHYWNVVGFVIQIRLSSCQFQVHSMVIVTVMRGKVTGLEW